MKKTLLALALVASLPNFGYAGDGHATCDPNDPKCKPACCAKDKASCCEEGAAKSSNAKAAKTVKPKTEKPVVSAAN